MFCADLLLPLLHLAVSCSKLLLLLLPEEGAQLLLQLHPMPTVPLPPQLPSLTTGVSADQYLYWQSKCSTCWGKYCPEMQMPAIPKWKRVHGMQLEKMKELGTEFEVPTFA